MDHDEAIGMLEAITAAFDAHDLDAILEHFADDAVFEGPRGPEPWGTRFVGKEAIREAFAARFSGIPDVRYRYLVCGTDRRGPGAPMNGVLTDITVDLAKLRDSLGALLA